MRRRSSKPTGIAEFVRPYAGGLALLLFLTVVLSVISMCPPLITRAIIDRVLTRGDHALFVPLACCMFAIPLIGALCGYIHTIGIAYIGQRFVFDVRITLFEHLVGLSLRYFGKNSVGKLSNRLMGDTGVVQRALTAQSISVVSDLICAAFAITATFAINWRLAILLTCILVTFVVNYRFTIRRIRKATRGYWGAMDRLSGNIQNRLHGTLAVKTFGTEGREHSSFREESQASLGLAQESMVASNTFSMNTALLESMGRTVMYFSACALVLRGELSYGDVIAFLSYAMQLLWPAIRFSQLAKEFQEVGIATGRVFEIFREDPEIQDRPGCIPVSRLRGQVDFDQVRFHYEEGKPVLRGFDLHIRAGETVALIGPTGCGKTTVLSLLMRFFDVCEGRVLLDGIDIRDIRMRSLRHQFGIVLQEPLLFSVSIAENIRYSRSSATQQEVEDAAKVAEIHDFIASLPDGYRTIIGSEGLEISVGQKQRITIARAVVANPAILIMDEATSALDSDSEQAIQRAMARVLVNRTSFIVAHRLSTIRNADRIVLIKEGQIFEMGTHLELMERPDGQYRGLYLKHMGSGVLEE